MTKSRRPIFTALIVVPGVLAFLSCSLPDPGADQTGAQGNPAESVPVPVSNLDSGTYENDIAVELSSEDPDGTVHYTLDGSTPTAESEEYSQSVEIPGDGDEHVLKAVTINKNGKVSEVVEKKYAIKYKDKVATPKLGPRKGTYDHPISVSITTATPGAVIHYTTDGSKPGPETTVYTGPIPIPEGSDILIKAVAYKSGLKGSSYGIGRYIVEGIKPVQDRDILFASDRIKAANPNTPEGEEPLTAPLTELYKMTPTGAAQTRLTHGSIEWEGDYPIILSFQGQANWSPDGKKIVYSYVTFNIEDLNESLYVMNADGTGSVEIANVNAGFFNNPVWSPDGSKLTVAVLSGEGPDGLTEGIYTMDPDGTDKVNVLDFGETLIAPSPSWTPDASRIVFLNDDDAVWIMKADGTDAARIPGQTTKNADPDKHPSKNLIAYSAEVNGQWDIYVMKTDGTGVMRLTDNPGDERWPDWSQDGTKLAFSTDRDGNWEIYTMDANGSNETNVSRHPSNDTYPHW